MTSLITEYARSMPPKIRWESCIPSYMSQDGSKSACLSQFPSMTKAGAGFEIATAAILNKDGQLSLKQLIIQPIGFLGAEELRPGHSVPVTSRNKWAEGLLNGLNTKDELPLTALENAIANPVLRRALTGHILALNYSEVLISRHLNKRIGAKEPAPKTWVKEDETLTEATVRIYKQLINWGETKPAALMSFAEGVTPKTIHNRLQQARAAKLIPSVGQGRR